MKVGILSMQRVNNYGSFWQAYCLKKIIEHNDCAAEFIDIIPGPENTRSIHKKSFSFEKIKKVPFYFFQRKKNSIFFDVQNRILGCMREPNYRTDYNVIIIGSDEVFNCVQDSPWGFSSQLYGLMDNHNINTYAASFGFSTLDAIERMGVTNEIVSALSNIKHISVRDQNSADIIFHLTGRMPEIHLDPVIIGELPLTALPAVDNERYILVYAYDFRFSDKQIIEQIREIAHEEKCKIYSVGFYQSWCDRNIVTDPFRLLSYFNNAQYIVTDTFHGTIFSTRLKKKFVTVIRNSNKQKLQDLLVRLNLESRQVSNNSNISKILHNKIDYDTFEHTRKMEQGKSEQYIRLCLGKAH